MNHESEDRLMAAARALRETPAHADVVGRGERAILARVGRRRGSNRPVLLWAAGFAAATAVVGLFALAPTRASAAELVRIAQNADGSLRHVRTYSVSPQGTLVLEIETYAEDGPRRRLNDHYGNQMVYDGRSVEMMDATGVVTVEHGTPGEIPPDRQSARALVALNSVGRNVRIDVARGVQGQGGQVDRYTIDRDVENARGVFQHIHSTLDTDPRTERPLVMRWSTTDEPDRLTTWEYPRPNPAYFRLPIEPGTRVHDLNAERETVMKSVHSPGRRATIGGVTVELLGLWDDDYGNAIAVARADYPYTDDYGLQIEGVPSRTPEKPPFSGQYMIKEPNEGYQLFGMNRTTRGPLGLSSRVTIRLPVSRGKTLLGFATFSNIPVHHAHDAVILLRHYSEHPFWTKGRPEVETLTIAKPDDRPAKP